MLSWALLSFPGEAPERERGLDEDKWDQRDLQGFGSSSLPGKIDCVKVEVEVHLLSACVGKSKDEPQ